MSRKLLLKRSREDDLTIAAGTLSGISSSAAVAVGAFPSVSLQSTARANLLLVFDRKASLNATTESSRGSGRDDAGEPKTSLSTTTGMVVAAERIPKKQRGGCKREKLRIAATVDKPIRCKMAAKAKSAAVDHKGKKARAVFQVKLRLPHEHLCWKFLCDNLIGKGGSIAREKICGRGIHFTIDGCTNPRSKKCKGKEVMCVFLRGNSLTALKESREKVIRLLHDAVPEKERLCFLVLLGLKNDAIEHNRYISQPEKNCCSDTAYYPLAQCLKGAVDLSALPQHANEWAATAQIESLATSTLHDGISSLKADYLDCRFVFLCETTEPWKRSDGLRIAGTHVVISGQHLASVCGCRDVLQKANPMH